MEKTLQPKFWLILGCAILIIAGVLLAVLLPTEKAAAGEDSSLPTEPPLPTGLASATARPTPTDTPNPTQPAPTSTADYQLPLLPEWDTPSPASSSPTPTPFIDFNSYKGRYNDECKDILVVGTRRGRAKALILMHVQDDVLYAVAVPADVWGMVYVLDDEGAVVEVVRVEIGKAVTLGGSFNENRAMNMVWAVKNLTGIYAAHYISIDLSCLGDVLEILGDIGAELYTFTLDNMDELLELDGEELATAMCELGVGLFNIMKKIKLWELPALKRAVDGKVDSSLSLAQLLALGQSIGNIELDGYSVLPLISVGAEFELNREESKKILSKTYFDS
ncbi:MAG TPA: hypothetical protein PLM48_07885 [Clostridia bacterium]|nr:hypothetical protein [Clostridia bacterium]